MTFSGEFDPQDVRTVVKSELRKLGLFLNDKKTVVLRSGQRKSVTGIVVNEKPNVSAAYRRKLRQELYYCQKYGIIDHMQKSGVATTKGAYIAQLLGRVNYVLSVDPENQEMHSYRNWLKDAK